MTAANPAVCPYFSSFSAHSFSYELSNDPKAVLKLLGFRFGPYSRAASWGSVGFDELEKWGAKMNWQVYIILCTDNSLYTGITTDIRRRFAQHAAGTGARFFRGHSPRRLVYLEGGYDRSGASRREAEIKRLRPVDKRLLIASPSNQLGDLIVQ